MAWMSDEQYELMQDTRDKKITARSAHNKRTHCGKGGAVRFPSDNLTKKEREAMNGECKSYRMNDPMSWNEFKELPDDLKVCYIKALRQKYNVPDRCLAEMFGIGNNAVYHMFKKLGLGKGAGKGAHHDWDKEGFLAWVNGIKLETEAEQKVEPETEPETEPSDEIIAVVEDAEIREYIEKDMESVKPKQENAPYICDSTYHQLPVIPKSGTLTFNNNHADDALATIRSLLCNMRANITISWETTNNDETCGDM